LFTFDILLLSEVPDYEMYPELIPIPPAVPVEMYPSVIKFISDPESWDPSLFDGGYTGLRI
jgi:hypothetical protein